MYDIDKPVDLSETPAQDWRFVEWQGDCAPDGSVVMDGDKSCTAVCEEDTFDLNLSKSGSGAGTVTSVPTGLSCDENCTDASASFLNGTGVMLQESAASGSRFIEWLGDADCHDGQVTVDREVSCEARFERVHTLTVVRDSGSGSGTVSSDEIGLDLGGIDCGETCQDLFIEGTVQLTQEPDEGSRFGMWSENCAGGQVNLTADTTCTVTFIQLYRVSIAKQGAGTGTVTSDPAGLICDGTCTSASFDFDTGQGVQLMQQADGGSRFLRWGGDPDCEDGVLDPLSGPVACTAEFERTNRLMLSVQGSGQGQVDANGMACEGGSCEFVFSADSPSVIDLGEVAASCSTFAGWSGDADCEDGMVTLTGDVSCIATFEADGPTTLEMEISPQGDGAGNVTSDPLGLDCPDGGICQLTVACGTEVTLIAEPEPGSRSSGFFGDPECFDGVLPMTEDASCQVNFSIPIFEDGFETGDTSRWSTTFPNPEAPEEPEGASLEAGPGAERSNGGSPESAD